MILYVFTVKSALRKIDVVTLYLILIVVAELKIGAVKKLVISNVVKQLQIVVAVEFLYPFRLIKAVYLLLKALPYFVRKVIDIKIIGVKSASV